MALHIVCVTATIFVPHKCPTVSDQPSGRRSVCCHSVDIRAAGHKLVSASRVYHTSVTNHDVHDGEHDTHDSLAQWHSSVPVPTSRCPSHSGPPPCMSRLQHECAIHRRSCSCRSQNKGTRSGDSTSRRNGGILSSLPSTQEARLRATLRCRLQARSHSPCCRSTAPGQTGWEKQTLLGWCAVRVSLRQTPECFDHCYQ